jgi:hypothetical protein
MNILMISSISMKVPKMEIGTEESKKLVDALINGIRRRHGNFRRPGYGILSAAFSSSPVLPGSRKVRGIGMRL